MNQAIDPLTCAPLQGATIRLEPLAESHFSGLLAAGGDPELWRWTASQAGTPEKMRAYLDTALHWRTEGHALAFATVLKATGELIGSTRFGNIDFAHQRAEIGWTWLSAPWQGSGANLEAKFLMLRHGFEQWGLNRIEIKTDVLNEKSRRAIVALGALQEGIARRQVVNEDGRVRDTVYYSIIAEEWPAVKARLNAKLAARGQVIA